MKRQDVYIIVFGALQLFFLLHAMAIVNVGAGITLMGEKGFFGYVTIGLFIALFAALFSNFARLVNIIGKGEDEALRDIAWIGRLSVCAFITLVALQFLNALSLYAQYSI